MESVEYDGGVAMWMAWCRVYSNVQLYPFCAVVNSKCAVVNPDLCSCQFVLCLNLHG